MAVVSNNGLTIAPGVAVVLRDRQGRVLLHRRHVGSGWAPVSGHLEPGESIAAGLRREVTEETALTLAETELVGIYSDPEFQVVTLGDGHRVQFVTSLFLATVTAIDELQGNDEATAWHWFDARALPDDLLPYAHRWLTDALSNGHTSPVVS